MAEVADKFEQYSDGRKRRRRPSRSLLGRRVLHRCSRAQFGRDRVTGCVAGRANRHLGAEGLAATGSAAGASSAAAGAISATATALAYIGIALAAASLLGMFGGSNKIPARGPGAFRGLV